MEWNIKLACDRVVVTGGGSGIGQGTALELARIGATVYVLGRRLETLQETVNLAASARGRIVPVQCDVTDAQSVAQAFAIIHKDGGPAAGLVHCAGSPHYVRARDLTPQGFREVVDSILQGTFNVIRQWGTALLDAGKPGVGIALTSAIASRGTPGAAHSSAAKAGVEALVKSIAREWGPEGLRVNVVGPGFVPVERTRSMFDKGQPGEAIVDQIAVGRLGTVEEMAGPIVFLLTEAASYITGHVLVPDGGFRLTPSVLPSWRFDAKQRI